MNKINNALKGMAMGIAEVIPGVSGGTIAFITGIYPKLINTIKNIDLELLKNLKNEGISGLSKKIDLVFLSTLITGMMVGLLTGIFGVTYLYENYPEPLWGFFFGLIVASSIYIGRLIGKFTISNLLLLMGGIVVAYMITIISPAEGSGSYWYVLMSGMLAIAALILPGISGSFILLLLGMYTVVIPAVKLAITELDVNSILLVMVFASGCLIGLLGFSRFLNFLFKNYEKGTLAVLTGFMIGSLNKIWPWRNPYILLDKKEGIRINVTKPQDLEGLDLENFKILSEVNVLPSDYFLSSPLTSMTIISFVVGMLMILGFYLVDNKSQK